MVILMIKLDLRPGISAEDLKQFFPARCKVVCRDPVYNSTTFISMRVHCLFWKFRMSFTKWSKSFDCDNFADVFKGFHAWYNPTQAIGTILLKRPNDYHAMNCFIFWTPKNGFDIALIEPQNGKIYKMLDKEVLTWRIYDARF